MIAQPGGAAFARARAPDLLIPTRGLANNLERTITMDERDTDDTRPDSVEEAGETTAAASVEVPADTRPVGEGTTADVEGDDGK
jgi:hypothetical protein